MGLFNNSKNNVPVIYLVGFIRVSDDLSGVADKEHDDDATKESSHSIVPPVAGRECVVHLTVPVPMY